MIIWPSIRQYLSEPAIHGVDERALRGRRDGGSLRAADLIADRQRRSHRVLRGRDR